MKAVIADRYGSPQGPRYEDAEKPVAGDQQILVRVRAAAVNPMDWHLMRGTPYIGRPAFGLRKPRVRRPGHDLSGVVESVGAQVTQFAVGGEVVGVCRGAFAEYACGAASAFVAKPPNISFEEAAAIPIAG